MEITRNISARERGLSRALAWIESALAVFSGLSLAVIMFVVVADVSMRYLAHEPFGWSYDLIGKYLMVCVFFFALSDTLHHHSHIAIDIFAHALPRWFEHLSLTIGYAVAVVIMAMIAWQGWFRFDVAYAANNLISATVPWPTWPSYLLVAVGSAVMALRCALRVVGHGASLVTGRELADMPLPPALAATDGGHGE